MSAGVGAAAVRDRAIAGMLSFILQSPFRDLYFFVRSLKKVHPETGGPSFTPERVDFRFTIPSRHAPSVVCANPCAFVLDARKAEAKAVRAWRMRGEMHDLCLAPVSKKNDPILPAAARVADRAG